MPSGEQLGILSCMKRYLRSIGAVALFIIAAIFFAALTRTAKAPVDGGSEVSTTTSKGSGGGGSIMAYHSGVQGTVSLGPVCPVERIPPDPACADKPYATAVLIYRTGSDAPFVIGASDSAGHFKLSLPPGSYSVTAGSGKTLPRCAREDAAVVPDEYTTVDISCDSGIR